MVRNNLVVVAVTVAVLGFYGINTVSDAASKSGAGQKDVTEIQPVQKEAQGQKKSEIKVTFVELGSVNCIPCKMMQPVMADIEKEYGDQVKVVFHDVWTKEGRPYGEQYRIHAIPTQVFLDKNGKEFFRHQGFFPKEEVLKILRRQGVK